MTFAPDVGVIRGFDVANEALRSYFDTFEDFYIELEEVVHADEERVVTEVHDGGRMPGSDSEVRNHRFHVFAFRDGNVVRFSSHLDRNRALEGERHCHLHPDRWQPERPVDEGKVEEEALGLVVWQNRRFGRKAALCMEGGGLTGYCVGDVGGERRADLPRL